MNKPHKIPTAEAFVLASLFLRKGYVRRYNPARFAAEGCMGYKKGDEIRLVADDISERACILKLVRMAGFKPGRPFRKTRTGGQYRIPLYGREQVARFLRMVEDVRGSPPRAGGSPRPRARRPRTPAGRRARR